MFNFKKKSLINYVIFVVLLLFICSLVPAVRSPFLTFFKNPLILITLAEREAQGLIFYHSNYVRNDALSRQVELLKQKLASLEEVSLENARLKDLLHFKQQSSFKVIAARVIGRAPDNWSSMIIVDKGSLQGIRPGMSVITYLGFVGRVVETGASLSKIMLANDPDFGVSAVIQRSRQEGLISGTLGDLLIMRYLPKDVDVKVSDKVVTSGLSSKFPKGLTIGTVVDIQEEFSGLGRYCLVKPAVNLSSIEEVLVIVQ